MSDPQQLVDMPGAPPLAPEPPTMRYWAHHELTLNGDDVTGLALNLSTGLTISGRVAFERKETPIPEPGRVRVSLEPVRHRRSALVIVFRPRASRSTRTARSS